MRKILFRAKRLDNGEWIHGYYATKGVDDKTLKHFICEPTFDPNGSCYCGMFYLMDYEVNPDTVGQFTNIQDKNGKEIYEGDIVLMENVYRYGSCRGVVKWDDGGGWFTDYAGDYDHRIHGASGFVIGNIHDNPELLKGGEK